MFNLKRLNNRGCKEACVATLFLIIPIILYWHPLVNNILMVATDGMISFTPKIFLYDQIRSGEIPLWNSYLSIGTPLYADPQTNFFYPFHLLALFFPPTVYTNLYYVIHLGLAGEFTYLFLKKISNNPLLATVGGILFMTSVCLGGLRKEHPSVYTSIVWMPLVLYFIQSYLDSGDQKKLVYSALTMMIQTFGGTPQWVVYSNLFVAAYLIFGLLQRKRTIINILVTILPWGVVYVLFSCILLVPALELMVQSSRGVSAYACHFSTDWRLFLMTLFPYVFGNNVYHPLGEVSAEISIDIYLGIIPLVYAIYGLRYVRNNFIKFATVSSVVVILVSSGCHLPFLANIFQNIPILNLFGAHSRVLFLYTFLMICCASYGLLELTSEEKIAQVFQHNIKALLLIGFVAFILSAVGMSTMAGVDFKNYYSASANLYSYTLAMALLNVLLTSFLFLTKSNKNYRWFGNFTVLLLVTVSVIDAGRFSMDFFKKDYDTMINTKEVQVIQSLPGSYANRVIPVYDDINDGYYYKSGLYDNWSMVSKIRNIKGFVEFENVSLNQLLSQTDSRDGRNTLNLLDENNILSMLSVKYILIPNNQEGPQTAGESLIASQNAEMIPGDGTLHVAAIPVEIKSDRNYLVQFTIETPGDNTDPFRANVQLFYVDFYGGAEYDDAEQQIHFAVYKGINHYSALLPTGNGELPPEIYLRFVGISNVELNITGIRMMSVQPHPAYKLVDTAGSYKIFENLNARELLFIPEKVIKVGAEENILKNPSDFPDMDKISYSKSAANMNAIDGSLQILSIKNNSVKVLVNSENGTFLNHSQAYYPGWRAYIDDKQTPIHLVNGVIQGVYVPAGKHVVKFYFQPSSLIIGAIITITALIATFWYLFQFSGIRRQRII